MLQNVWSLYLNVALMPNCADAKLIDSSGRTVLHESYSTARYGMMGPLTVLRDYCNFESDQFALVERQDTCNLTLLQVDRLVYLTVFEGLGTCFLIFKLMHGNLSILKNYWDPTSYTFLFGVLHA